MGVMSASKVLLIVEDDKKRAEVCSFLSDHGVAVDARKSLPEPPEASELRRLKKELAHHLRRSRRLEEAYDTTLENFMAALDLRDVETYGHSKTVARYSHVLAEACGVSDPATLDSVRKGALLHDAGKMAIPDSILKKPGPLTAQEWAVIRRHPALGYGLVRDVKLVPEVGNIILCHHEKFDGTGYPKGLKGAAIPLEARVFAVADTLDAVTSHRPYRGPARLQGRPPRAAGRRRPAVRSRSRRRLLRHGPGRLGEDPVRDDAAPAAARRIPFPGPAEGRHDLRNVRLPSPVYREVWVCAERKEGPMKRSRLLTLLLLGIVTSVALAGCGKADDGARIARVENGLQTAVVIEGDAAGNILDRMKHYGIPGVSVAVFDKDRVVWAKGYGVMDVDTKEPVTEKTLFVAGSISKPVAAMGALKLVEEGKIRLDDNINAALTTWKLRRTS